MSDNEDTTIETTVTEGEKEGSNVEHPGFVQVDVGEKEDPGLDDGDDDGETFDIVDPFANGLPMPVFRDLALLTAFHALMMTRKDNDKETMRAIMDNAGGMTAHLCVSKEVAEQVDAAARSMNEGDEG